MSTQPRRPEHADKVEPISGADSRFTIQRHLEGYAYSRINQACNTTPEYRWVLLVDGRPVDSSHRKRDLVAAARVYGKEYLNE